MKRQLLLCILGAALAAHAAPPSVECFELTRVRLLDSPFKVLQQLHRKGLVGHLEPDKLLFGFRKTAGLPQPSGVTDGYGGWDASFIAGHYGGHYLSAAARMYAATGDTSFRDKTAYMVRVLAVCQAKLGGGYLSAFPSDKFDQLAGELGRETMPASDIAGKDAFVKAPAWPVPVFVSATPGQPSLPVEPLPEATLRFEAGMLDPANRRDVRVRLAPLHRVHHQRFAVYWKVVTPERK